MNYRLLLPLILLCSTCSASAQERWFEVELLLFKRNVDINHISEDLAVKDVKIDTSKSIPLLKTAANN
ncbi:MAG: peptidoglycan binding protein CsiV, partial [Psychromonas sp.]|nr:peptidoglycan binding protein CsiV [Psychromonas sp.]